MRQNRLFCCSSLLLSAIAVSLGHTAPGHAEITGVTVLVS
jgi:hypothetical protein